MSAKSIKSTKKTVTNKSATTVKAPKKSRTEPEKVIVELAQEAKQEVAQEVVQEAAQPVVKTLQKKRIDPNLRVRFYYIRTAPHTGINEKTKKSQLFRGDPIGCLAYQINCVTRKASYGISSLNPEDTWDKRMARSSALLNLVQYGYSIDTNENKLSVVLRLILETIKKSTDIPSRVRRNIKKQHLFVNDASV